MAEQFDIQKAIVSHMRNTPALMSLINGVYDDVPQAAQSESNTAFPFVVVGDMDVRDWSTDTEVGFESDFEIHVWSRYSGKKELSNIMSAVHNALNRQALTYESFSVLDILFDTMRTFLDPDGRTRHGIMTFTIRYEV